MTIKKCPFCGKQPQLTEHRYGEIHVYSLMCRNDTCVIKPYTPMRRDLDSVIHLWNRRVK